MSKSQIEDWPAFVSAIRAIERDPGGRQAKTTRIRMRALSELSRLRTTGYVRAGEATVTRGLQTDASFRNAVSRGRSAVREALGDDHRVLKYLRVTDEIQAAVNEDYEAKVIERHRNRRPLAIESHVRAIEAALRDPWNEDIHPFEIAGGLIAATGRRAIEIFFYARYGSGLRPAPSIPPDLFRSSVRATKRHAILFADQAKTRGSENAQTEPYVIPVLVDPALVFEAWRALCKRAPDFSEYVGTQDGYTFVESRTQKDTLVRTKRRFLDAAGVGMNPKDLRAAYARAAYELYAPAKVTDDLYFGRILGHSPKQMRTALSYDVFYAVGAKRKNDMDFKHSLRHMISLKDVEIRETSNLDLRDKLISERNTLEALLKAQ